MQSPIYVGQFNTFHNSVCVYFCHNCHAIYWYTFCLTSFCKCFHGNSVFKSGLIDFTGDKVCHLTCQNIESVILWPSYWCQLLLWVKAGFLHFGQLKYIFRCYYLDICIAFMSLKLVLRKLSQTLNPCERIFRDGCEIIFQCVNIFYSSPHSSIIIVWL